MRFNASDRCFVKRSAHRGELVFAHRRQQAAKLTIVEPRLFESLDVFNVLTTFGIGMNKAVQIAILKFETEFKVVAKRRNRVSKCFDDCTTMSDIAHMVVCHLKYDKRFHQNATPENVESG